MGDLGGTSKTHGVKGVSTAFWSIVLVGSTVSIAAGFAGGRSIGSAGSLPVAEAHQDDDGGLPAPLKQRTIRRSLFGAHSLDAAGGTDPFGDPDVAVSERSATAGAFDSRNERAQIAVIVVDAGRAGPGLDPFVASPLPMTMAVAPGDDDAQSTVETLVAAGKSVVADATAASPGQVAALVRAGAGGVLASLPADRAAAVLHAAGPGAYVVDAALDEDDDVWRTARQLHRRVFQRDVIADARDESSYVDFMLRDALAIAQRTGSAIVAVHARSSSFDALTRFADRAQRDGADIVALSDLGR
jgi:hypothetical protein